MPSILLIKTSSLGDVLHNLPVVSDIVAHLPDARIDWVVEENFAALPALHPRVNRVIPVAMRRWRHDLWQAKDEMQLAQDALRASRYDFSIDTQGLLKSALLGRIVQNLPRCGMDWHSAREPLASLLYTRKFRVEKNQHAVERNRQLAAQALGYTLSGAPDYGIQAPALNLPWLPTAPYAVLLHATSRDDKLWDEANWIALGEQLQKTGIRSVLPWGNAAEQARAERLAEHLPDALVAPRLTLPEAAYLLAHSQATIGVDTGLNHLAAALNVPTIGLYTATDPSLTGLYAGQRAVNLGGKNQPPSVDKVWTMLEKLRVSGL